MRPIYGEILSIRKGRGRSLQPVDKLDDFMSRRRRDSSVPALPKHRNPMDELDINAETLSRSDQSQRNRALHQHITDFPDAQRMATTSEEYPRDSDYDADYENEGDILEVKVKRGARSKQHITEPVRPGRPGAAEGAKSSRCEPADSNEVEVNGDTSDHAAGRKDIHETKHEPELWGFFPRYKASPDNHFVQPSRPVAAPCLRAGQMSKRPNFGGGHKPINRFKSPNQSSSTKILSKARVFDITNDEYRPDNATIQQSSGRPPKRHRVGDGPVIGDDSPKVVIEIDEEEPARKNSKADQSMLKPRQIQGDQGQQRISETVSQAVEVRADEAVARQKRGRPTQTRTSSSKSPTNRGTGDDILKATRKQKASKQTDPPDASPYELKDDVIVDDHPDERKVRYVSKSKPQTHPQVQISALSTKDNIYLHHAKSQLDESKPPTKSYTETGKTSAYFSKRSTRSNQPQRVLSSVKSDMGEQTLNGHIPEEIALQPNRATTDHKARNPTNALHEDEPSLDDLGDGHYGSFPDTAAVDSFEARSNHNAHSKSQVRKDAQVQVVGDSDSDDELTIEKANILEQVFIPKKPQGDVSQSKKATRTKSSDKMEKLNRLGQDKYSLTEIFSEDKKWLVYPATNPWYLLHMPKERQLRIFDESQCFEFDIMTHLIDFIEMDPDCPKIIIHRRRTTPRDSSNIYIEFGEAGGTQQEFRDRFRQTDSTVPFHSKDHDYLDRCFLNNRNKKTQPLSNRPSLIEDLELTLLQKRQRQKLQSTFDKAQQTRQRNKTTPMISIDSSEEVRETPRVDGIPRKMQNSKIDISTDGGAKSRNCKDLNIPANNFYGSSDADHAIVELSHGRRSSTRIKNAPPQKSRSSSPVTSWTRLHPDWGESWPAPVVFAGDGKARATVEKTDIPKLDEGEFLNDSLIYFYLLYLQKGLAIAQPDLARRIYVQNSFFYERLTNQEKGKRGGINYEAVRRWTDRANVDIFKKDYVVIPVNENLHWWVAIICNAPRFLDPENDGTDEMLSPGEKTKSEDTGGSDAPVLIANPSAALQTLGSEVDNRLSDLSLNDVVSAKDRGYETVPDDPPGDSRVKRSLPKEEVGSADARGLASLETDGQDDVVAVQSDLIKAPGKTTPKRKRKRISVGRKYDPKEPRIITLDSFGHSHSPACTNLKEYLIAELKAKHTKDIPPPGSLGMTAKDIPLQNNYCDCGVFMLGYMERFFQDPDDFVHGILQGRQDVEEKNWINAPELRNNIRDLLFDLQIEQAAEPIRSQLERKRLTRAEKLHAQPQTTSPSKSTPEKGLKSDQASDTPDHGKLQAVENAIVKLVPNESDQSSRALVSNPQSSRRRTFPRGRLNQETSEEIGSPISSSISKLGGKGVIPDSDTEEVEPSAESRPAPMKQTLFPDVHELETDIEEKEKNGILDTVSNFINKFRYRDKKEEQDRQTKLGSTGSQPLEIDDSSPKKADRSVGELAVAENSRSVTPEEEFAQFRPRGRQRTPYPRDVESLPPTPDILSDDSASLVGLEEPYMNGSSAHVMVDGLTRTLGDVNHDDDEMLLSTVNAALDLHSPRASLPPNPADATPDGDNGRKKRHRSEDPQQRKRMRVDGQEESAFAHYRRTGLSRETSDRPAAQKDTKQSLNGQSQRNPPGYDRGAFRDLGSRKLPTHTRFT